MDVFLSEDHVVEQFAAVDRLVDLGHQSLDDVLSVVDDVLVVGVTDEVVKSVQTLYSLLQESREGVWLGHVPALAIFVVAVVVFWHNYQEVLQRVYQGLRVEVVQEALDVALVAKEVAADLFLVLLEEGANNLGKIAQEHTIDLFLGVQKSKEIIQVFLVV